MHFLLLGEGPSDLGLKDIDGTLKPGLMTILLETLRRRDDRSFSEWDYTLYTRIEAKKSMKSPRFSAPRGDAPNKPFRNSFFVAMWLAKKACEKSESCGVVYFEDADRTNTSPKNVNLKLEKAIMDGFKRCQFDSGVPMVPNPRQEAWLLGYYQEWLPGGCSYQNCQRFENLSGNDAAPHQKNAKKLLDSALVKACKKHCDMESEVSTIEWDRVNMPSLNRFRDRLSYVLRRYS